MLRTVQTLLANEGIDLSAPVLLRNCHITRPYLLAREGIENGTAIMLAVPYISCEESEKNLSAYAIPRDYHLFFRELFARLLPLLRARFPAHRFAGFADHSPIDEIHAALTAGLGIMGDNGLLLTKRYSSYIFLGEIITDALLPTASTIHTECLHCGACLKACPVGLDKNKCLSALTQKKGELTETDLQYMDQHELVWGCDICQEACPYTAAAKKAGTLYRTPSFFQEQRIPVLTLDTLDQMSDEAFSDRAYAWRGRNVIRRNLLRKEK